MDAERPLFVPEQKRAVVACPYCGSTSTELLSLFGQQLLTVQYYCQGCHTPFEYVKDDNLRDKRVF